MHKNRAISSVAYSVATICRRCNGEVAGKRGETAFRLAFAERSE
jgi:hypothetical protein